MIVGGPSPIKIQAASTKKQNLLDTLLQRRKKKDTLKNRMLTMQWQNLLDEYGSDFQWERGMGATPVDASQAATPEESEAQLEIEGEGGDISALGGVGDAVGGGIDMLTETIPGLENMLSNLFSGAFGGGDDDDGSNWWDASGVFPGW
jgi:hypothetical protein